MQQKNRPLGEVFFYFPFPFILSRNRILGIANLFIFVCIAERILKIKEFGEEK